MSGSPVPEDSLENMQVIPPWCRKNRPTVLRCSIEDALPTHRVQDACHPGPPESDRGHGRRRRRRRRTSRPAGPFRLGPRRREPEPVQAPAPRGPERAPAAAQAPRRTPPEPQPSLPPSRTSRTHVPSGCVAHEPGFGNSSTMPGPASRGIPASIVLAVGGFAPRLQSSRH